jgi:hypothetical protein
MRRRILVLDVTGAPPAGLLEVELGTALVFTLRPSPRVDFSSLTLWTNAPQAPDAPFRRFTFAPLEGGIPEPMSAGDWVATLSVVHAGCFEFFVEFAPRKDGTEVALTPAARGPGQPSGSGEVGSGSALSAVRSSFVSEWDSTSGSGEAGGVCGGPPPPSRGPLGRFVVQPQLSVRLARPVSGSSGGCGVAPDALLPGLSAPTGCCEELVLPLAPDGLSLQTQLTRCLGPIDGWLRYEPLAEAARAAGLEADGGGGDGGGGGGGSGNDDVGARIVVTGTLAEPLALRFNMLHFSPPQRLGGSRSCYSLKEQLCLDWDLFAGNAAVCVAAARACEAVRAPLLPRAAAAAAGEAEARLWAHPYVEGAKSAVLQRMLHTLETQHGVLCVVARWERGRARSAPGFLPPSRPHKQQPAEAAPSPPPHPTTTPLRAAAGAWWTSF